MQAQQGQRGLCSNCNNVSAPRATTPVWQGQWHQCNSANMPAQQGQQWRCNNGDDSHATWGQRGQRNKDNKIGTTRATMPIQYQQWYQCNEGDDAIVTIPKTPALYQLQWRHHDKGNNTSLMTAAMPSQQMQQRYCNNGKIPGLQRCLHIDDGNTIATRQQFQLNDSKDACALMMVTTPLLWGQLCQVND
jgi:hypothetical protein